MQFSKVKIAEEKDIVEIKTADGMNARNVKNAYINAIKNVMSDKECQRMSEICQSELRSVSYKVTKNVKQNDKNNVSGLKELPTESLDTNSMKKTFKVFNISKTLSSKKSKTKIISSQNILPALSTPTKQKLLEEKTNIFSGPIFLHLQYINVRYQYQNFNVSDIWIITNIQVF